MATQAPTAPLPGPKPGQFVKESQLKREAFEEKRLTFLEHSTGGIRRVVMPDGISLAEFRNHAVTYLARLRLRPTSGIEYLAHSRWHGSVYRRIPHDG
jgi:hypothetical protein